MCEHMLSYVYSKLSHTGKLMFDHSTLSTEGVKSTALRTNRSKPLHGEKVNEWGSIIHLRCSLGFARLLPSNQGQVYLSLTNSKAWCSKENRKNIIQANKQQQPTKEPWPCDRSVPYLFTVPTQRSVQGDWRLPFLPVDNVLAPHHRGTTSMKKVSGRGGKRTRICWNGYKILLNELHAKWQARTVQSHGCTWASNVCPCRLCVFDTFCLRDPSKWKSLKSCISAPI